MMSHAIGARGTLRNRFTSAVLVAFLRTLPRERSAHVAMCVALGLVSGCDSGGSGGGPPDDEPPIPIELVEPAEGSRLGSALVPLRFSASNYSGALSVDSVTANDADITPLASVSGAEITVTPTAERPWETGPLVVSLTVSDDRNRRGTIESRFEIAQTTQALPRANPTSGFAPLTVALLPDAATDSVIELYEWEIDGDGLFDESSDTIGRTVPWTFDAPGTYPVELRVTDTAGEQNTGTVLVTVENRPPVVIAEAVPSNGAVPLTSRFTVTATDNEGIALYEIDFDGDGSYDESSESSGSFSFEYVTPGNYQPVIRVTDTLGVATEIATPDIRVDSLVPGSPAVQVSARFSRDLRVPLEVSFAGNVRDPDREAVASWAWDFDGDGTVDSTEGAQVSHTYERPGIYYAELRVVSEDGDTSRDVVRIEALPSFELSYSTDTIRLDDGETADVNVTVGGVTPTGVHIEDRGGNVVRTLREFGDLAAGEHTFTWDGNDDSGDRVAHGPYYAILTYEYRGPVERIGTSEGTVGVGFRPELLSATTGEFRPFGDDPVRLEVGMPTAGELTLFMGNADDDQRTKTFFEREPFGAGEYAFEWYGVDTAGRLVPDDGTPYTVGMFGFSLGDNVIFVRDAPEVEVLDVSPKIYTPGGRRDAVFSATLAEPARVELRIRSLNTGRTIRSLVSDADAAGTVTLDWDGTSEADEFPAPGRYSASAVAVDASGARSIERTSLFHIAY